MPIKQLFIRQFLRFKIIAIRIIEQLMHVIILNIILLFPFKNVNSFWLIDGFDLNLSKLIIDGL